MSRHLLQSFDFLKKIESSGSKIEILFTLRNSKKSDILSIIELCINLLIGNFELTEEDLQSLSKYRNLIRKISEFNSLSWKKAKTYLLGAQRYKVVKTIIDSTINQLI